MQISIWKDAQYYLALESESEVTQLCPTHCDPMDCSLPGSSLHGILQARVLEWGAISFSRGSSWPRDRIRVFCIPSRRFTVNNEISLHTYWSDWNLRNCWWGGRSTEFSFSVVGDTQWYRHFGRHNFLQSWT